MRLLGAVAALLLTGLTGCGISGLADRFTDDAPPEGVVEIRDTGIQPDTAHLPPGGRITWVNRSTLYSAAILLPRDVIERLDCPGLRPSFSPVAEGYRSEPLESGGEETALPCPLPPGEYVYQVQLFEGYTMGTPMQVENPYQVEEARIIVE
jgi:hypothetical protein